MIKINSYTVIENGNDYGETTHSEKILDSQEIEKYRASIEKMNKVKMIETRRGQRKNKIVLFNYEEI